MPCHSIFFLACCFRANIPSAVYLPLLKPYGSFIFLCYLYPSIHNSFQQRHHMAQLRDVSVFFRSCTRIFIPVVHSSGIFPPFIQVLGSPCSSNTNAFGHHQHLHSHLVNDYCLAFLHLLHCSLSLSTSASIISSTFNSPSSILDKTFVIPLF